MLDSQQYRKSSRNINITRNSDEPKIWFVMRDLKRSNANFPAYKLLESLGVTHYTPMHWVLATRGGQKKREYRPFIPDLLFVYETRKNLDAIVSKTPTLQYRFVKGGAYREAMVVAEAEMNRFMHAVGSVGNPRYYLPSEITSDMRKRRIRIVGGNMYGYEGRLLSVRGSRVKRIMVELPTWLVAPSRSIPNTFRYYETLHCRIVFGCISGCFCCSGSS